MVQSTTTDISASSFQRQSGTAFRNTNEAVSNFGRHHHVPTARHTHTHTHCVLYTRKHCRCKWVSSTVSRLHHNHYHTNTMKRTRTSLPADVNWAPEKWNAINKRVGLNSTWSKLAVHASHYLLASEPRQTVVPIRTTWFTIRTNHFAQWVYSCYWFLHLQKNATKPNPSETISLQNTWKENNWKTKETLARRTGSKGQILDVYDVMIYIHVLRVYHHKWRLYLWTIWTVWSL
jgi:hypothetical protein